MLTKSKIAWAINETHGMKAAARLLSVSYNTFKKYAKMYDLFQPLPNSKGIPMMNRVGSRQVELQAIFKGEHPSYSQTKLQERLIREAYVAEECCNCGYCDRRIDDLTIPLILDYIDDDGTNKALENLRLLCFNCFYIMKGNRLKVDIPKNVRGFKSAVNNLFSSKS
jgi:hypothetical protein